MSVPLRDKSVMLYTRVSRAKWSVKKNNNDNSNATTANKPKVAWMKCSVCECVCVWMSWRATPHSGLTDGATQMFAGVLWAVPCAQLPDNQLLLLLSLLLLPLLSIWDDTLANCLRQQHLSKLPVRLKAISCTLDSPQHGHSSLRSVANPKVNRVI